MGYAMALAQHDPKKLKSLGSERSSPSDDEGEYEVGW